MIIRIKAHCKASGLNYDDLTPEELKQIENYLKLPMCRNCINLSYKTYQHNLGRCSKWSEMVSLDKENESCFINKDEAPKENKILNEPCQQLQLWDYSQLLH